jgi:hypothetical protein
MTIHLKHGGSNAARTLNCAAWHQLSDTVPLTLDGGSNPAADEGTMLHNVMEEIYGGDDWAIPHDVAGVLLKDGREYKGQELTPELHEGKLIPAIDAIESLMDKYGIDDWEVEPFVRIADDIGGSIDFLGISDDLKTVVVVDYKFGFHSVNVRDNAQLQFYALAAATDAATSLWFEKAEKIVLAVIQPNDKGPVTDLWELDMDVIDAFETKYLEAVDLSDEPDSLPTAGDWCKYCPAQAICPAKTGEALKASRVSELTADKLAEYLPMAAELAEWIKAVNKMAHEQLELGVPINGWKLVNKRASRVWNDPAAVDMKVRKAKKIKIEDGFDLVLKSPAQMEKVCKKLKVDFKQYDTYISSVSSGTTLAVESDKRPAALPLAGLEQLNALND